MSNHLGVTVCIPIYNGSRYLNETLASVVSQTGIHLQIVVGDDGSTDESMEIAKVFSEIHPQHDWTFLSSKRMGMASNWNTCIAAAKADFVKVMGQDDILYPGILADQANLLSKHDNVSLVVSGCDILSRNGTRLFTRPRRRKEGIHSGPAVAQECLKQRANLIGEPVTAMTRKDQLKVLGGFSSEHRYYIDLELWLRLMKMGDLMAIIKPQCAFRIHKNAVSSQTQRSDFDQFESLPGADETIESLSPVHRFYRIINAKIFTCLRSLLYRVFG